MRRESTYEHALAETRLHRIPAPGATRVMLGLLEKRSGQADQRLPPLLLVHGATLGASLFDLPRPGYSLMAWLASRGRAVYAVDVRGFGNSLNGAVMDAPSDAHPAFARMQEAVADIGAAVDLICERERVAAVDLVGFSWGTITSARYATEHCDRVERLVLYAPLYAEVNPLWLDRIADPRDRTRLNPAFGAYHLVTKADLIRRWNGDLPTSDPSLFREKGLPDLVFEVFSALDPRARAMAVPAFRCPCGPLADLVGVFNGRPLYDPRKLTMPTLLLRGSDDSTSTDADARRLLAEIASPEKSYGVVAPGSHFLIMERNRSELYARLDAFLGHVEG
jgi:pimeloyl-ACP methyl ester carboxylesterase